MSRCARPAAEPSERILAAHGLPGGTHLLLTAHRAGNVDDPARLVTARGADHSRSPAPWCSPCTRAPARASRTPACSPRCWSQAAVSVLTEPLGYVEFGALLRTARAVLTDSGGVQKEAYLAGVPCVTLRANTEWVETVASGWNTLVDLDADAALRALASPPPAEHPQLYGDGHAAERCVQAIGEL